MEHPRHEEEAKIGFAGEGSMRVNPRLTRVGSWVMLITVIAGLLAVLAGIGCQAELPPPGPPDESSDGSEQLGRELPALVKAGDEFEVTVTFAAPTDGFHAVGLTEIAPSSWQVSVDVAWSDPEAEWAHTPEPDRATYVWEGPYDAGAEFTAVYKVKVPIEAVPGVYSFSGSLEYYIEPHPAPSYEEQILGDAQVSVSS